jgi:hypothetical protein
MSLRTPLNQGYYELRLCENHLPKDYEGLFRPFALARDCSADSAEEARHAGPIYSQILTLTGAAQ